LYFNSQTTDNAIYLGTDIEYDGNKDIYYVTQTDNLVDIFSLNKIGTQEDYDNLKMENIKVLFVSNKNGSKYSLCTKIEKEELTTLEQNEKDLKGKEFTELYEK
jgi:hypothetical protein